MTVVYVFVALFLAHICAIITGAILGWIGYFRVKSTLAKSAAVLYLIAAICFPLCFVFAIPITIFGFLGSGDQKELNEIAAMESQNFRSTSI